MKNLRELLKKINLKGKVLRNEPMSRHTTFRIGGPADALIIPEDLAELSRLWAIVREEDVPCFLLGEGANILVSDKGIRGIVLALSEIKGCRLEEGPAGPILTALTGTPGREVCEASFRHGLSGIEFLSSMPCSIGGAVWMNALCYGSSIADNLDGVEIIDEEGRLKRLDIRELEFGYKSSPFQDKKVIICRAGFRLNMGNKDDIRRKMEQYREDRERKGHFLFPSAGSVFKNSRELGTPAGKIIDSLDLLGTGIGGARVSDLHGNIIINTGKAQAGEVLDLIRLIEDKVRLELGFNLEREIILAGEW